MTTTIAPTSATAKTKTTINAIKSVDEDEEGEEADGKIDSEDGLGVLAKAWLVILVVISFVVASDSVDGVGLGNSLVC